MSPVRFVTYVSGPDKAVIGGEGGIRTHGTLAGTTVFETAPIDHSGTSPQRSKQTGRKSRCKSIGAAH